MSLSKNPYSPHEYQLIVEDIFLTFGGINALSGVSTGVKKGEIFAIIGPNGAGKTCLLNCINRFYHPGTGKIIFEGKRSPRLSPIRSPNWALPGPFRMWNFSGT